MGTLFLDEDDNEEPCVFHVVEIRAQAADNNVSYVPHFDYPDEDPPENSGTWLQSTFGEVQQ